MAIYIIMKEITGYSSLVTRYSMLETGQIVDNLAPIDRQEGDIFFRGCWMSGIYLEFIGVEAMV